MTSSSPPPFRPDIRYLAEGGQETELMYGHGFDLPQFALFPLLDNSAAVERLTSMYRAVLDVAVAHDMGAMLGGLDYRASPDWAGLLGIDAAGLDQFQKRSIEFLQQVAEPYRERLSHVLISGAVGPRGDAYERSLAITPESAEEYHSVQIASLAAAGVDLVQAMTFSSGDEAIGVIRAARNQNLPIIMSFMPNSSSAVGGVSSLRQLIEQVDQATEGYALFYGLNCSHPLEFEPLLEEQGEWISRLGMLRPNASAKDKIELCQIGHLERGDIAELAEHMGAIAVRLPHIAVWGGCCGTWDEHLDRIATAIEPVG
ncbi:MAG: homocysteine S-methyltransferase family protein [Sphingomicrobium sp.]